ncbi:MAG: TRAP transporter small permease, partial [Synergistaceae bacterium]|nr:TRAP transporter small permease [Synergistaceae bacterium]
LDEHFEEAMMSAFLLIIAVSIMAQVIMRYIFNSALSWPEEISRYSLVIFCFMTIGYCVRKRSSLRIDTFVVLLPLKLQVILNIVFNIVLVLLYGYLCCAGFLITKDAFVNGNVTSALGIPLGAIYSITLFGLVIAILRLFQMIVLDVYALSTGQIFKDEKELTDVL